MSAPQRTFRLPWLLAAALILPLAFPLAGAVRDIRAEHLLIQAEQADTEGRFDEALSLYREASRVNPRNAEIALAHAQAARTLWFYRDDEALRLEADEAYERASAFSPHWSMPYYRHARMYAFKRQYARALDLLAPALQLDPNNAGYWLEQARYQEGSGQVKRAQEAYARCWALDKVGLCAVALKRLRGQP